MGRRRMPDARLPDNHQWRPEKGRTMNIRNRLAVLPLLFLLTGCPLESTFSLGDSNIAQMDQRLVGRWVDAGSEKSAKGTLSFYRFNEHEYYIETIDNENNKTDRFRGYLTLVDNVPILNVQEITENKSSRGFLFIKVSIIQDNLLKLNIIEDSLLTGKSISSRNDLFSYIATNIDNANLYDNVITLIRKIK
ncbi:MAG: hypothetical protein PHN75_16475 [Syntrophales bacterium]|nr:hypothetical protein [Syntrophales bacterium]